MSRTDALGNVGNPSISVTLTGLTLSGTNRVVYAACAINEHPAKAIDTVTIGGVTIYDRGVDESRRIAEVTSSFDSNFVLSVFRIFDADLPANGDRDVVFTFLGSVQSVDFAVAYNNANQTTGHRGAPVTYTTEDAALSLAIDANGADQEGLGFMVSEGSSTPTATSPTTSLATGAAGTAVRGAAVARPTGGTPLEATISVDENRDCGWGASILTGGGGFVPDEDYMIFVPVRV